MSTPLERLLMEALPTGTFGDRPAPQPHTVHRRPWSADEQARHRAELEAELDLMEGRGTGKPERHLKPVPAPTTPAPRRAA